MGYVDFITTAQTDQIKRTEQLTKHEAVHFYVQKGCKSHNKMGIIPFDLVKLNMGNAFNPFNGVFTVPKPGVYQFNFTGKKTHVNMLQTKDILVIFLRVNGVQVAAGASLWGFPAHPISLHATLKLKKGDRVDLFKTTGALECIDIEAGFPTSHFTGSLLQED